MFQRSLFMTYAKLLVIAILIVGSGVSVQGADRAPNHGLASIQGTDNPGFPIMFIRPHDIAYPTFTHPSAAKNVDLALINIINTDITFGPVVIHEDSCKGPGCGPTGWLNYAGLPAQVPALTADTMSLVLNAAGVISSGPTVLYGRLIFEYGPPTWSDTMHIVLTVADTIQSVLYDSIATAISIKLAVANNGNLGKSYAGNLNMNFRPPTECDTGLNSRGDAGIYLGDASPVIVRKVGSNPARASWSIFGQSYDNPNGFKPLAVPAPKFTDTTLYQRYFSGEFLSSDSLVKVRRTYYAPKTSPDSANFIVVKTQVTPNPSNSAVTNLQIGDAFDWDIPSDSGNNRPDGGSANVSGYDLARRLVWARGFNSSDTVTDCWDNSLRYGGAALLKMGLKANIPCSSIPDTLLYGGYSAANDSFVYKRGEFVPEQVWNNMKNPGYINEPRTTDVHIVLTYKGGATGYTLPANDTLTIYTALAVGRAAANSAAGLDSLKRYIDQARKWSDSYLLKCCCIQECVGVTGNVNGTGGVDLADLSALVSYLTGGGYVLPMPGEANVNKVGAIDLADLSALVNYLTGGGYVLPDC
jgi:hypothetical protein